MKQTKFRTFPIIVATLCLAAPCLAGCAGEGLEGNWSSIKPVADAQNQLVLEAEGQGSAKVHIFLTVDNKPQAAAFEHDVDWIDRGDEIDFELQCEVSPFGECDEEDDISMDCSFNAESRTMKCEAQGRWRDYDFQWRKDAAK
jgi:hypothetical protein